MSKDKKITQAQLRIEKDKVIKRALVLMVAVLMDEYGYTKEECIEFAKRYQKYNDAIEEHLISVQQVREIISKELDLELEFI